MTKPKEGYLLSLLSLFAHNNVLNCFSLLILHFSSLFTPELAKYSIQFCGSESEMLLYIIIKAKFIVSNLTPSLKPI